jgi:hypothetical protein
MGTSRRNPPPMDACAIMRSDGMFIGAEDIIGMGDVRIRIVEAVEHRDIKIAGRNEPRCLAIVYDRLGVHPKTGDPVWIRGKKQMKLNRTNWGVLWRRFSTATDTWGGKEIVIYATPVEDKRQPGGWVLGVRIRPTTQEKSPKAYLEQLQRVCGIDPSKVSAPDEDEQRQPGEDDEPPPSDEDTTEPPDGWKPGEAP